jgi:hypothetical protein
MLDSGYGPDEANEMAYNDEPDDPGSERGGESWPRRRPTGIDVRFLPAGTEMVVDTRNSRYRLVMVDGIARDALVEGGRHFPSETTARIEGSSLPGSLLKIGWIGLGLPLELSRGYRRIVTSAVRSIRVDGSTYC